MEAAIDRIMQTYDLLVNRSAAASAEARAKVTEYVTKLFEAGEKDTAPADRVRADLFARTRRLNRSGEGGVYRAVGSLGSARQCSELIRHGRACLGHRRLCPALACNEI